ncbi:MAG: hypothetical protein EOO57_16430, partial [Hymenobacter sp.]
MKNLFSGSLLGTALALLPLVPALAQQQAGASQTQPALPAQPAAGPMSLSLGQAVRYAVQNKPSLLATRLAEQTAAARVGEIKSQGLPQVNIGANVADNFKLQQALVSFPLSQTVLTQRDLTAAQTGSSQVLGTQ